MIPRGSRGGRGEERKRQRWRRGGKIEKEKVGEGGRDVTENLGRIEIGSSSRGQVLLRRVVLPEIEHGKRTRNDQKVEDFKDEQGRRRKEGREE